MVTRPLRCNYMQVGIRELKAKLSEYVSAASSGEAVVVTDRGRPVARLVPYDSGSAVDVGVDEGWIESAATDLSRGGATPCRVGVGDGRSRRGQRLTLYVDSSALLKRYVDERDSEVAVTLMGSDPVLVATRLTEIEVRRNLARLLDGRALTESRRRLAADLDAFALVALDAVTCAEAARIAEQTLCRSLDALHLAAASQSGVRPRRSSRSTTARRRSPALSGLLSSGSDHPAGGRTDVAISVGGMGWRNPPVAVVRARTSVCRTGRDPSVTAATARRGPGCGCPTTPRRIWSGGAAPRPTRSCTATRSFSFLDG